MDPTVAAVIAIIGKYSIDKGVELLKEAGPKAVEVAEKLLQKVADSLRKNPGDIQNLERFKEKPDVYQAPVADAISEQMKDTAFASEIEDLLKQYRSATKNDVSETNIITQYAGNNAVQIGQASGSTFTLTEKE